MLAAMSQQAFAFIGAIAVVGIVLTLATRRGRLEPVTLLLVGVIMNAILGAVFLLFNALFPAMTAGMGDAAVFLVGGIQTSLQSGQKYTAGTIAGAGWIVLLFLSWKTQRRHAPRSRGTGAGGANPADAAGWV